MTGAIEEGFELLEKLHGAPSFDTFSAQVTDPLLRSEYGCDIVALRIPRAGQQRRLRRDIEAWSRRRHVRSPHLLTPLDFCAFRGAVVLVLPFVDGDLLSSMIGHSPHAKALPAERILPIAREVLDGLCVLHAAGLIHRNVRPDSIWIDGGVAKLDTIDLYEVTDDPEASLEGVIAYLAPELLRGSEPAAAADVWSWGVSLYVMSAGLLPFGDLPNSRTIDSILAGSYQAPSLYRDGLDPRVDDLVARALHPVAQRRPSAADLLAVMEQGSGT